MGGLWASVNNQGLPYSAGEVEIVIGKLWQHCFRLI